MKKEKLVYLHAATPNPLLRFCCYFNIHFSFLFENDKMKNLKFNFHVFKKNNKMTKVERESMERKKVLKSVMSWNEKRREKCSKHKRNRTERWWWSGEEERKKKSRKENMVKHSLKMQFSISKVCACVCVLALPTFPSLDYNCT